MDNNVYVTEFEPGEMDIGEVMRYSRTDSLTPELSGLIDECKNMLKGKLSHKVCYIILPIKVCDTGVDFGAFFTESKDLVKNLSGCKKAVIFAATVGMEIDRLIRRYSVLSPARCVIFQAMGAERCESLCDLFNDEIKKRFPGSHPRFSPGYGDFPLECQSEIFKILNCKKNIGISLGENLLMTPSKSVTAVIGISDGDTE